MAARIKYTYAGYDFDTLGIVVSASAGVVDLPEQKDRSSYEWTNMNGRIVDTSSRVYYKQREITLTCKLRATSASDFMTKLQQLQDILDHSGLAMLKIDIPMIQGKPLVYMVYPTKGLKVTKQWSSSTMVGSFDITLEEPEPLKRVFKASGASTGVTATLERSGDVINVYWGDGSTTLDQTATYSNQKMTLTHNYTDGKTEHYIVVTGDIQYAQTTESTAELIWSIL